MMWSAAKLRTSVKRAVKSARGRALGVGARFAPRLVKHMATTGSGTDACLRRGAVPLPIHFYSPVPDIEDLDQRGVWKRRSELAGVEFDVEGQLERLAKLGARFGDECDWPAEDPGDPSRFFTENGTFSFGCAASTYCTLRDKRPRRVIEVGSGNSSKIIALALERNGGEFEYTVVDPFPGEHVRNGIAAISEVRAQRVELVEPGFFEQLDEGDVLFVDSGHTVRVGGDVNHLILDVLPRLKPGVTVHFHDIHLPDEYPRVYATNPAFRVYWTESYLLQAFLAFNSAWDVRLAMSYLMTDHLDRFGQAFPHFDAERHRSVSGSFWIQRR